MRDESIPDGALHALLFATIFSEERGYLFKRCMVALHGKANPRDVNAMLDNVISYCVAMDTCRRETLDDDDDDDEVDG